MHGMLSRTWCHQELRRLSAELTGPSKLRAPSALANASVQLAAVAEGLRQEQGAGVSLPSTEPPSPPPGPGEAATPASYAQLLRQVDQLQGTLIAALKEGREKRRVTEMDRVEAAACGFLGFKTASSTSPAGIAAPKTPPEVLAPKHIPLCLSSSPNAIAMGRGNAKGGGPGVQQNAGCQASRKGKADMQYYDRQDVGDDVFGRQVPPNQKGMQAPQGSWPRPGPEVFTLVLAASSDARFNDGVLEQRDVSHKEWEQIYRGQTPRSLAPVEVRVIHQELTDHVGANEPLNGVLLGLVLRQVTTFNKFCEWLFNIGDPPTRGKDASILLERISSSIAEDEKRIAAAFHHFDKDGSGVLEGQADGAQGAGKIELETLEEDSKPEAQSLRFFEQRRKRVSASRKDASEICPIVGVEVGARVRAHFFYKTLVPGE
ncbi:hypothetical protein AK812_SmicGene14283 [Symbiodinium microadriaticum]|uniref:EF-hand domain-containing protein n=1 Tax=Symbiodinium microadriaticum TaxID=2951 RepID=A0A1Q9E5Z2_SYMMI|nr:hypothetical protein AK812_SmicGene14283 [Symbiodinium microadriaticum]